MDKRQLLEKRWFRAAVASAAGVMLAVGAMYLYFHNPMQYPLPCLIHLVTGLYCPGCGAGRASFSILHGEFREAFCYNPLMTILLPFIGLYIVARCIDWVVTGKNHIDRRISVRFLIVVLVIILIYGVLRNIPVYPFILLAPGGMEQIL